MSDPSALKLLGISGSLRAQSYNSGALQAVASLLPSDVTYSVASLADVPFYNFDVEQRGFPAPVETLRKQVAAADALIFAVPEYNFFSLWCTEECARMAVATAKFTGKRQAVRYARSFGQSARHRARSVSPSPCVRVVEHDPSQYPTRRHHQRQDQVRCRKPADRPGLA